MSLETGLIFVGGTACVVLAWYLYRRSQNETSKVGYFQSVLVFFGFS